MIFSWYAAAMPTGRPPSRERTALGERIAQARHQAGLSQIEVARQVGVSQRVVAYWEREAVSLRADQLDALASALGLSADALLGRRGAETRSAGPVGRTRRAFEALSRLPRRQQQKIVEVVETLIAGQPGVA